MILCFLSQGKILEILTGNFRHLLFTIVFYLQHISLDFLSPSLVVNTGKPRVQMSVISGHNDACWISGQATDQLRHSLLIQGYLMICKKTILFPHAFELYRDLLRCGPPFLHPSFCKHGKFDNMSFGKGCQLEGFVIVPGNCL